MAPTIATVLLHPQDRVARQPLDRWAGWLHDALARCRRSCRQSRQMAEKVGSVANNVGLIAMLHGDLAAARQVCEGQIRWQSRLSRRARNPAVAPYTVQPWVNLRRLEAVTGEPEAALAHLARLNRTDEDGRLALSPLRSDGVGCQRMHAPDEGFGWFLETVYVVDSLKALLQNHRYAEVPVFAGRLGARRAVILGSADEAVVVALCRLGDHERARQVAQTAMTRAGLPAWFRVTFKLRLAEVLACAGRREDAAAVLSSLVEVVRQVSAEAKSQLQVLYVMLRMGAACREIGLDDAAYAVAGDVLRGARAADDEVFQIEALRLLAALAPAGEREKWGEELARLEESTLYARLRRGGPPPPHPAIERLFAELGEFLAT